MDAEEAHIKQKFMDQQLARASQAQLSAKLEQAQIEEALKKIMPNILEKAARERLANLKMVKPDLALQLQVYLFQIYQAGQLTRKVTDAQLVTILKGLSQKKDIKIKRK